jgi:hypothetical protein
MSRILVPKISNRHVANLKTAEYDYLLGNYTDDILDYDSNRKLEYIDKTNDLEFNGFKFLSQVFDTDYYIIKNLDTNSAVNAVLNAISPHYSLIHDPAHRTKFMTDFMKHIGFEMDEKTLFKRLNCGHYKLKRKELIKICMDNKNYDQYCVLKYLAIRFNIGITILEDDTFQIVHRPDHRKSVVMLKNDTSYYLLCSKSSESYLYNWELVRGWVARVKTNLFKLESVDKYKVGDLRDIAKKNNIDISSLGKKDEIYAAIQNWLKNE